MAKSTNRKPGFNSSSEGFQKADPVVPKAPEPSALNNKIEASSIPSDVVTLTPVEVAAKKFSAGIRGRADFNRRVLESKLSLASIVGMEPAHGSPSFLNAKSGIKGDVNSNIVEAEVAATSGKNRVYLRKSAGSTLPIVIAQRINEKYPVEIVAGARRGKANPKAVEIARRYISLFGGVRLK